MMTTTIIYTIISLCAIGIASAVILYFVAQKFKVEEDPRIDTVESILPGANCGGCGKPGCRGFAEATVDMGLRTSKVSTWGFPEQKNIVGFPMFTKQELIF